MPLSGRATRLAPQRLFSRSFGRDTILFSLNNFDLSPALLPRTSAPIPTCSHAFGGLFGHAEHGAGLSLLSSEPAFVFIFKADSANLFFDLLPSSSPPQSITEGGRVGVRREEV